MRRASWRLVAPLDGLLAARSSAGATSACAVSSSDAVAAAGAATAAAAAAARRFGSDGAATAAATTGGPRVLLAPYKRHNFEKSTPPVPLHAQERARMLDGLLAAGFTTDGALHVIRAYERNILGLQQALAPAELPVHASQLVALGQEFPGVNLPHIIATDCRLLLRTVPLLAEQLTALWTALREVLPHNTAITFMNSSVRIGDALRRPERARDWVASARETYTKVVGRPPAAAVLACRSSHLTASAVALEVKLQHLVDALGSETTHALVSRNPHLLSSAVDRLLTNMDQLRATLDLPQAEVAAVLSKQPRLMSTRSSTVAGNLAAMQEVLGCSEQQAVSIVKGYPGVLSLCTATLASRMESLRELLPFNESTLMRLIKQQPTILGLASSTVKDKLTRLEKVLDATPDQLAACVRRSPSLLTITPENVQAKLEGLTKVLGVSLDAVRRSVRSAPMIVIYTAETLVSKVDTLHSELGLSRDAVLSYYRAYPSAWLMRPSSIVARVRLFMHLIAQSPSWTEAVRSQRHPPEVFALNKRLHSTGRRLLMRMEYLLATGQDRDLSVAAVLRMSAAQWAEAFGDSYERWAVVRVQQLARDPPPLWRAVMEGAPGTTKAVVDGGEGGGGGVLEGEGGGGGASSSSSGGVGGTSSSSSGSSSSSHRLRADGLAGFDEDDANSEDGDESEEDSAWLEDSASYAAAAVAAAPTLTGPRPGGGFGSGPWGHGQMASAAVGGSQQLGVRGVSSSTSSSIHSSSGGSGAGQTGMHEDAGSSSGTRLPTSVLRGTRGVLAASALLCCAMAAPAAVPFAALPAAAVAVLPLATGWLALCLQQREAYWYAQQQEDARLPPVMYL